ncbi:MAG: leucine-rich repeat domain-containing protein [Desulfamplus sp.]|nr:leucine-rich repeat domain-containing protein [Desulfamplus sp.]
MNNKALITTNSSSLVVLEKSKNLLAITDEILQSRNRRISDDSWIYELWDWADANVVPDYGYVKTEYWELCEGLPRTKEKLLSITKLFLNGNQLINLPDSIGNLNKITELRLGGNKLIGLPESIGDLTQLSGLLLNDNYLVNLPDSIGKLTQLTQFYLNNNHLTNLPESIINLTQLTELQLDSDKIAFTPKQTKWIEQLKNKGCDVQL